MHHFFQTFINKNKDNSLELNCFAALPEFPDDESQKSDFSLVWMSQRDVNA